MIQLIPCGESAVIVEFGTGIHPEIHYKVKAFTEVLDTESFPGMIEYMPAYASVTVFYDPVKVKKSQQESGRDQQKLSCEIVCSLLERILGKLDDSAVQSPRVIEIPVCYGGEFGPDLEYVAEHNHLTVDEVIHIHVSNQCLVYMIGFAPGFPYLGGMSERIATPRRITPRPAIPAGSVGIAGLQTGVYPITTPGGWQLIGRTPLALFRPYHDSPSLLQAGDLIQFRPISAQKFEEYKEKSQ